MSEQTDTVIAWILDEEGGIADVGDGKGITYFGQTQDWLDEYGLVPPTTMADAAANYEYYLHRTGLEQIVDANLLLGHFVVDDAIHSGTDQAIRDLQSVLGVAVDGDIGPETVGAVKAADAGMTGVKLVVDRCHEIGDLLASTTVDRRKWSRGWHNRLGRQIERLPALFGRKP